MTQIQPSGGTTVMNHSHSSPTAAPARRRPAGRSESVRRRTSWMGDLFGTAGIAVVVVSVALWVRGGGIEEFSAVGGPLTSIGRLSGLVASALLLLQVLLMARLPCVETVWGQDTLARKHRLVGFTSFHLMLVHIVAITIGYAQAAHVNLLGQLWDLLIDYPGMLLAAAGTLALIMVVLTSLRAARRRLRYESWHLLHLYAYLGVGLALPHQLWTGSEFTSSPVSTLFWWSLWGAAAAAVLAGRLLLPIATNLAHQLRVETVIGETPGVVSVVISGRKLDRWVQPGQFCQWRFLGGPGWTRSHPYSISAVPTANRLRITVKALGDGSAALPAIRPGARVLTEGPYGVMTADRRTRRDVVMICAGVGITPLRALAEHIAAEAPSKDWNGIRPAEVTVLHRISGPEHATFAAEFDALARVARVRLIRLVGPRGSASSFFPGSGPVDPVAALEHLVPHVCDREVYLCGPKQFTAQARAAALSAGVPRRHIHAERFGW